MNATIFGLIIIIPVRMISVRMVGFAGGVEPSILRHCCFKSSDSDIHSVYLWVSLIVISASARALVTFERFKKAAERLLRKNKEKIGIL